MGLHVLLANRRGDEVLPGLPGLLLDLKVEELSVPAVRDVLALRPEILLVDAGENPAQAHVVLREVRERDAAVPVVVVVERRDLERFPWSALADELLYPGAPEAEIQVRLAMLHRRLGRAHDGVVRLGPLVIDPDGYTATLAGRPLDLTYKEFELLRFLAERPGRVFSRPSLLREVWGFDFYGGTRTVDVHVRRLRAKLGPEHEHLIGTVRGVGYRASAEREP